MLMKCFRKEYSKRDYIENTFSKIADKLEISTYSDNKGKYEMVKERRQLTTIMFIIFSLALWNILHLRRHFEILKKYQKNSV